MAHGDQQDPSGTKSHAFGTPAELGFLAERVTGIEPALSAWESAQPALLCGLTCGAGCPRVTVTDPSSPGLMAR
jgi:hypothetical protein